MSEDKVYLSPLDLSNRWGGQITIGTLKQWRSKGKGPKFRKVSSKIVYHIDDVKLWESQNVT